MQHEELTGRDAGPAERVERLQGLAVVDPDARRAAAGDVEETLFLILREGDARHRLTVAAPFAGGFAPAIDPRLIEVLAVDREHLHALATAIGRVDQAVVRHL